MDSSGNLYGTTASGGAEGDGTVFELAKGSSTITTLASLQTLADGNGGTMGRAAHGQQRQSLWHDRVGGPRIDDDEGTVFELAQGSGTITTLALFNGTNGAHPEAALIMDSSGNLYGTTDQEASKNSAPFSSLPREAAPSPPWLRSTAPTVTTQKAP